MSHPLSVLIVDDESSIRSMFQYIFVNLGYQIAGTGCNGVEAIEMTRALQPDFLIMDINMPVLGGLDAAERILSERKIPIVVCSGAETPENQHRAAEIGVRAFLPKPFRIDGLNGALETAGVAAPPVQAEYSLG